MAIDVLLSFNFAAVFNFNLFPFLPSKPQFLGDVPMNRQNEANCSPLLEIFYVFLCKRGRLEIEIVGR